MDFKSKEIELIRQNFIKVRHLNKISSNEKMNIFINHWFFIFDQIVFYHHEEIKYNNKIKNIISLINSINRKNYVGGVKFRILNALDSFRIPFNIIFAKKIIFPGVNLQVKITFFTKIIPFIQALLLNGRIYATLKSNLTQLVNNSSLNQDIKRTLISCVPNSFFCESIHLSNSSLINIYCSPQIFLEYNLLSKFLLIENINIIGLQHGCGYGLFNKFPSLGYERGISDQYFGWGLLERNIVQTRFGSAGASLKITIYWVGRAQPNKISQGLDGDDIYTITNFNLEAIDFIECLIARCNLNYVFLGHPSSPHYYYNQSILQNKPKFRYANSESLICLNDIVIFDTFTSTLIYFCIYNRIKFVIISDSSLLSDATLRYLDFIKILKKFNYYIDSSLGIESCIGSFNNFINDFRDGVWVELSDHFQASDLPIK